MKPDQLKTFLYICELAVVALEKGHHVFVNFSPHVLYVDVRIYIDGWKEGAVEDIGFWCRAEELNFSQTRKFISTLENLAL